MLNVGRTFFARAKREVRLQCAHWSQESTPKGNLSPWVPPLFHSAVASAFCQLLKQLYTVTIEKIRCVRRIFIHLRKEITKQRQNVFVVAETLINTMALRTQIVLVSRLRYRREPNEVVRGGEEERRSVRGFTKGRAES